MLRGFTASPAAVFTRSPARVSLHALSSQARLFWTLTISSMSCAWEPSRFPCDFWKLLQHRVSSHNWTSTVIKWTVLHNFSATLHLWRLSLHHNSTLFCCGGFCQSCGKDQTSITSSHPMIPVLCLLLRSCHARLPNAIRTVSVPSSVSFSHCNLRCCQLAQSCPAIQQSSLLNCALCLQSSCHSNTEFFKLAHSSSWHDFRKLLVAELVVTGIR